MPNMVQDLYKKENLIKDFLFPLLDLDKQTLGEEYISHTSYIKGKGIVQIFYTVQVVVNTEHKNYHSDFYIDSLHCVEYKLPKEFITDADSMSIGSYHLVKPTTKAKILSCGSLKYRKNFAEKTVISDKHALLLMCDEHYYEFVCSTLGIDMEDIDFGTFGAFN